MRKLFGFKTNEGIIEESLLYYEICKSDEDAKALLDRKDDEVHRARMIGLYSGAAATWIGLGIAAGVGIAVKRFSGEDQGEA